MVPLGIGLDFTSVASILSVAFALSIATESYIVFRRTERQHLLAFMVGFILLAVSYALLIPLAFGIKLPTVGYETSDILDYPPRIVISSLGFIIIALSYTPTRKVRGILYGLIALLAFFVALVFLPNIPSIPYYFNSLLYLLHAGLLIYIIYRIATVRKPSELATLAFLFLLTSQGVGLIDSLIPSETIFLLGQAILVISFAFFFTALARAIRPRAATEPMPTKTR